MKFSPRDFFLNVAAMAALYVSAVSLITLLFQYIDYLFPDRISNGYYADPYSGGMRFAIATLIIVFPLYLFFTRMVHQDIRRDPTRREGMFRKWLVYLTLFVAGATVAGDLIALIHTYLLGEISTRFTLKVLIILIVAGAAFWYYWHELKGTWESRESESKLVGATVLVVVLASLVGGFLVIGSPSEQRALRFDRERVGHLQMIQGTIVSYWQAKEKLPETLSALEDPILGFTSPRDPETDAAYVYTVTGPRTFKLCATFGLPSDERRGGMTSEPAIAWGPLGEPLSWQHGAGEKCFERTIDPELFRPYPTKPLF